MLQRSSSERGGFITLQYQLSWPTTWDGIVSFLTVAGADMRASEYWSHVQVELSGRDMTDEFLAADGNASACLSAQTPAAAARISGFSRALNLPVRITAWNESDSCSLILPSPAQVASLVGESIQVDPLMCDRYMDALEILSHRDRIRRQYSAAA